MRECFGDGAAWIPYIRPGFTLSKQVGEAARANPDLKLVVLAKHGLVVWGDTAEEAYRKTIEVINEAVEFANETIGSAQRFGGPHPKARLVDDEPRAALLHELLPADARCGVERDVQAADGRHVAADAGVRRPPRRPRSSSTVGAPCPDHLVHTKRVPLWIPFDPETDDADALRARIAERAAGFRDDYRAYVEEFGDETTVPGRPGSAHRADPAPRARLDRHDDEDVEDRRAISITARSR